MSTIGSVTYDLSKYLAGILAPLVGKTDFSIKDSYSFTQYVKTLTLDEGEVMVSFDVQSLFTSVPTEEACDVARRRLEREFEKEDSIIRAKTSLDVDDIILLLRLCLSSTYFQVNGKFIVLDCIGSIGAYKRSCKL